MIVSQNRGPSCTPKNTIVLFIGTPQMVPLVLGKPPMYARFGAAGFRVIQGGDLQLAR